MTGQSVTVGRPTDLTLVGKTFRNFSNLGCTAIATKEAGFPSGAKLFFETDPTGGTGFEIIASSVQIGKQPVDQVKPGQKCAVHIGSGNLPRSGTLVFVVN
ncbi:hypothetical protein KKF61_04105 [Patescibacteria group bacterium]|nr:hypothetical protein [Patescibacteria group bacterium]MBU0963805.1 hypothetical protein [Patescibacteria group bacterium]